MKQIYQHWESWNSLLRKGASSKVQVLRTITGVPCGLLDLEVSSWRLAWQKNKTVIIQELYEDNKNEEKTDKGQNV